MTGTLWQPTPESIAETAIADYLGRLERERGLRFDGYADPHRWSCESLADFWQTIWNYFEVSPTCRPSAS